MAPQAKTITALGISPRQRDSSPNKCQDKPAKRQEAEYTVSVFAVGALLGKISALWLLSACALAYIIGMIWYMLLYKKYMK